MENNGFELLNDFIENEMPLLVEKLKLTSYKEGQLDLATDISKIIHERPKSNPEGNIDTLLEIISRIRIVFND